MSLSDARITPQLAVSDMARARDFYEGKLGFTSVSGKGELTRTYPCGDGTTLSIYVSPERAGRSSATLARWDVDDLEPLVDELSANGVVFEQYDEPVRTNAKGIHDSGYGKIAWIRDPDGNTFELSQTD
jgi:catechol 2,3-dioxygenase-like lactoylglutathione lyase family enzyme